MPEIKLNATLRAYSRAPYFTDWLRDITSQENIPDIQDIGTIAYARAYDVNHNPVWVQIDTTLLNREVMDDLKELVINAQQEVDALEGTIDNFANTINFELQVAGPYANQLVFTNAKGETRSITLPSSYPDNYTISTNDEHLLYVMDTADQESIVITDIKTKPILDTFNNVIGVQKTSGKLRADKLYVGTTGEDVPQYISGSEIHNQFATINRNLEAATKNITDLENYIQGKGGFIDPHNFGPTKVISNEILNQYYYDVMNEGAICDIPDQTKVKNLYDGCIWVYVLNDDNWLNEGADVVVTANNDGVLGVVTGSDVEHHISINEDGVMTVNGLQENITNLSENKLDVLHVEDAFDAAYVQSVVSDSPTLINIAAQSAEPQSLVKRTSNGTILSETKGDNMYETVNLLWLLNQFATSADIDSIKPRLGDN